VDFFCIQCFRSNDPGQGLKVWKRLLFKLYFARKYIKILIFYILKIIFHTSHQNDLKIKKNQNTFKTQKKKKTNNI